MEFCLEPRSAILFIYFLFFLNSGIGGWILPDDNGGFSDSSFPSPTRNLQDITNDLAMYVMLSLVPSLAISNLNYILGVHAYMFQISHVLQP